MIEEKKPFVENQGWLASFKNAINGCLYAFKTQRNFRVHLVIALSVIGLGFWLKIGFGKFIFLILAIFLGITVEMANTAFEKTVDLIVEEYHPQAKIAKDLSAGMMLLISIGLALIGFLILFPPLWERLFGG